MRVLDVLKSYADKGIDPPPAVAELLNKQAEDPRGRAAVWPCYAALATLACSASARLLIPNNMRRVMMNPGSSMTYVASLNPIDCVRTRLRDTSRVRCPSIA